MPITLVRHSAYVVTENPCFEHAVEPRGFDDARLLHKIKEAGGYVFCDWADAEQAAEYENYPPGTRMSPRVRGKFARMKIDGAQVYVPAGRS